MLMGVNIRCHICLFFSICTCVLSMIRYSSQLFCTYVVIWSYTTVPVAFRLPFLSIFRNLEVQERYFANNQRCSSVFAKWLSLCFHFFHLCTLSKWLYRVYTIFEFSSVRSLGFLLVNFVEVVLSAVFNTVVV